MSFKGEVDETGRVTGGTSTMTALPPQDAIEKTLSGVKIKADIYIAAYDETLEQVTICYIVHALSRVHLDELDECEDKPKGNTQVDVFTTCTHLASLDKFRPQFYFRYGTELMEPMVEAYVNWNTGQLYHIIKGTCTFGVENDFRWFPYDVQLFRFQMDCQNGTIDPLSMADDLVIEDPTNHNGFNLKGLPSAWVVQGFEVDFMAADQVFFSVIVSRKSFFYFVNYAFIIYAIVLCNGACGNIPTDDLAGRTGITVTLLLTLAAFKFTLQEGVSHSNYLTWMETYFIVSFLVLLLGVWENVLVSLHDDTNLIDAIYHFAVGGAWTIAHIVAAVMALCYPNALRPSLSRVEYNWAKNLELRRLAASVQMSRKAYSGQDPNATNNKVLRVRHL